MGRVSEKKGDWEIREMEGGRLGDKGDGRREIGTREEGNEGEKKGQCQLLKHDERDGE